MIYICVPTYNEAPTIGVLLWRIRKVFQGFPRDYELLVCDDGSTDATQEILAPYAEVLPVTVLGGPQHLGYAAALDQLLRAVVDKCKYVRRDAIIVMQADFTDQPELLPEMVRRFEGGADVVVAEAAPESNAPRPVRRLRQWTRWLVRPATTSPGVRDPFGSFRAFRVAVVRDAIRAAKDAPVVRGDGWGANLDLLLATLPHARKVETVSLASRYDIRPRASRVRPFSDALRLYHFARAARARHTHTLRSAEA